MARASRVLPGFRWTMGFTLAYWSLMVLLPLVALAARGLGADWRELVEAASSPRAVASYRLTIGAALAAAVVDLLAGSVVAWVLVRYRFAGRRLMDALIDLPFALPTAVSGIALTTLYAPNGWLGRPLATLGVEVAYTPLGIVVAMSFIGLPFVVRALQPALEELPAELEEAAASLGAGPTATLRRVLLPALAPALATGFALAFARSLGEYGSVVFIAGNMPMRTEITSLLILTKLEQFDYAGAVALALVMIGASLAMLLVIGAPRAWADRRSRR